MSSRLRSQNSTKISFFAFQDIITSVSGILILVTLLLATELNKPSKSNAENADPELEQRLSETLRAQVEVDNQNQRLQELLKAAETAPAPEKLDADIQKLQRQLTQEQKQHSSVAEQLAANQAAMEARDRTLGLTGLKTQIQKLAEETRAVAANESKVRKEMAALDQRVASVQSKILILREREGKLWLIPEKSFTGKEPLLVTVSSKGARVERFDHPEQTKEFEKAGARSDFSEYLSAVKPSDQYVVFLVRPSGIALFQTMAKVARDRDFEIGFDPLEEDKNIYFSTPPVVDETTPVGRRDASGYQTGSGGYSDPSGGSGGTNQNGTTTSTGPKGGRQPGNVGGGSINQSEAHQGQAGRSSSAGGKSEGGTGKAGHQTGGETPGGADGDGSGKQTGDQNGTGAWKGDKSGDGGKTGSTNGSSVSKQTNTVSGAKAPQPVATPQPKAKSWWQRFLEFIGIS